MTWRKHAASPAPLGVHGTIRLRFAGASTRAATSSAVASSESISAADGRLARVVVVEGRVLVLGEKPAGRVGLVAEQIAHRVVELGAAQASRHAGRDRVVAGGPRRLRRRCWRATPMVPVQAAAVAATMAIVTNREDALRCAAASSTEPVYRARLGARPRISPTNANRCERVGAVGVASTRGEPPLVSGGGAPPATR